MIQITVIGGALDQFRYLNCLKTGVSVLAERADLPDGTPFTRLQVLNSGLGGQTVAFGDCAFGVRGDPLSLNNLEPRTFPILPGGSSAASNASAASPLLAAATAADEIDGFLFGRVGSGGEFVAQYEATGLGPIPFLDFLSIITDSRDFDRRFEDLFDGADAFAGAAGNDRFITGAGDDEVAGLGGDDTVFRSRAGALVFNGGPGSDTLALRGGEGVVYPNAVTAPLVLDLATGAGSNPYGGGALTLVSVENVIGTRDADTLMGNDRNNVFGDGQFDTGADVIDGRGGNDTVKIAPGTTGKVAEGGAGTDTLFFQFDRFVNRLDLLDQSRNSGVFEDGTFTGFEQFERGTDFGSFDSVFEFRGDGAAQTVSAFGSSVIELGGGDDRLVFQDSSGPLVANGGAGMDELVVSLRFSGVVLDLANPAASTRGFAGAAIDGFERFTVVQRGPLPADIIIRGDFAGQGISGSSGSDDLDGRGGNDTLSGGGGADTLLGKAGADMLKGGGGADLLNGGGGNDRLLGGPGADRLLGKGGADTLIGGAGGDRIEGGRGADLMKGGGGADVFFVRRGDGADRIEGFQQGRDRIEIGAGADDFGDLAITQNGQDAVIRFANVRLTVMGQSAADFDATDFLF